MSDEFKKKRNKKPQHLLVLPQKIDSYLSSLWLGPLVTKVLHMFRVKFGNLPVYFLKE